MRKPAAFFLAALALAAFGSSPAACADETEAPDSARMVRSMPSEALSSLIAGKTFRVRVTGYGWMDGPDSINLDFTVTEPLTYSAEEIESLESGDILDLGMDSLTVASVGKEDGAVRVVPEEEWLSPVTFTEDEGGRYTAGKEDGEITADSFSFPARLRTDLVYVNTDGESLAAEDLLKDLEESALDFDTLLPEVTFDEAGCLTELNFGS